MGLCGRIYEISEGDIIHDLLHLVYRKESDLVLVCREQPPEGCVLQFLLNSRRYRTFSVQLTGVT